MDAAYLSVDKSGAWGFGKRHHSLFHDCSLPLLQTAWYQTGGLQLHVVQKQSGVSVVTADKAVIQKARESNTEELGVRCNWGWSLSAGHLALGNALCRAVRL